MVFLNPLSHSSFLVISLFSFSLSSLTIHSQEALLFILPIEGTKCFQALSLYIVQVLSGLVMLLPLSHLVHHTLSCLSQANASSECYRRVREPACNPSGRGQGTPTSPLHPCPPPPPAHVQVASVAGELSRQEGREGHGTPCVQSRTCALPPHSQLQKKGP